jgi:hypothetical protein
MAQSADNTHRQNGSQEPQGFKSIELCRLFNAYPQDAPERLYLLKFWLRMAEMYRQLWTHAQGDLPTDLWAKALLQVGEKAAFATLVHFLKNGQTYPPTLPEFYAATYRYRLDPSRFFFALPRPPSNPVKVKAHLATIKAALSGA